MDQWLLQWCNQLLIHPVLDGVMAAATVSGPLVTPFVAWQLIRRGHVRLGRTMGITLAVSLVVTALLYYLVLRPRPTDVRLLLPMPPFPSFVSGHCVLAFATAVVLALGLRRRWLTVSAFVWALLVAYSRLYLGHHYPSDLLGGAVVGLAIGAAVYGLRQEHGASVARLRWLLWPQAAIVVVATEMAYLNLLPGGLLLWPYADKVLHALLFGAVVFWLNLWLAGRVWAVGGWTAPVAVLLPFSLAMVEEGFQSFSPLRTASLSDLTADLIGMACFWWLSQRLLRRSWNDSNRI
ncbi:MAG: VanZ family protein [Caldilineaceae bacterium]